MPDDDKPADKPLFTTAAEALGIGRDQPPPTPGLSHSPNLRAVEDSPVPNTDRSHVMGPGQAAADPVLAGLDVRHNPMTRAENRAITQTDGNTVAAAPDSESDALPGPNSTNAPAAKGAAEAAEVVTPTAVLPTGKTPNAAAAKASEAKPEPPAT